jgi:hypothetical protein
MSIMAGFSFTPCFLAWISFSSYFSSKESRVVKFPAGVRG